jgi:hypothetical protein
MRRLRSLSCGEFPREAGGYEEDTRIENGLAALYRQVDTQSFVFVGRSAVSTWRITPPNRERFPTYVNQNAPQSRIHRINQPTQNWIEGHRRRIFPDTTGEDHYRPAGRNVPLGKAIPQACDRGSTDSKTSTVKSLARYRPWQVRFNNSAERTVFVRSVAMTT